VTNRRLAFFGLAALGLGLIACSDGDLGASEVGIQQSGQEAALNGTWRGTLAGLKYTIVFQDGRVIENWLGNGYSSFHAYGEAGFIGFYSLVDTAFAAAMNDASPGAPVTHITARLQGTLAGNQLTGTDDSGARFSIAR
jgi:hypothetical protein